MSHISTTEQRALAAFTNLFSQLPGKKYDDREYRLLVIDQDSYLILNQNGRFTVFDIFPQRIALHKADAAYGLFHYLCKELAPCAGYKELRFTFNANKKLQQGARNFVLRAATKFNLQGSAALATSMGL